LPPGSLINPHRSPQDEPRRLTAPAVVSIPRTPPVPSSENALSSKFDSATESTSSHGLCTRSPLRRQQDLLLSAATDSSRNQLAVTRTGAQDHREGTFEVIDAPLARSIACAHEAPSARALCVRPAPRHTCPHRETGFPILTVVALSHCRCDYHPHPNRPLLSHLQHLRGQRPSASQKVPAAPRAVRQRAVSLQRCSTA